MTMTYDPYIQHNLNKKCINTKFPNHMYPHVHPFTLVTIRYTYTDIHIEPFPSTENEDGKPNQRKV